MYNKDLEASYIYGGAFLHAVRKF